jgi:hypothetical protein
MISHRFARAASLFMIRRSDTSASSGVLRNRTRCDAAPVTDESRKHRYEAMSAGAFRGLRCVADTSP